MKRGYRTTHNLAQIAEMFVANGENAFFHVEMAICRVVFATSVFSFYFLVKEQLQCCDVQ